VTRRLWRSGEPFIWLTAGALAMALIMVGGLLAIIVVNAAGFFWPSEVVRLTLKDGTVLTGPVTER
jgi:phosphate transport system permease protein